MNPAALAAHFLGLHQGPRILVLPNAWDAASACVFASCGFPAIATTSAGIACSHGYPDGQHIGRTEMLAAVRRIVLAVDVPVTADVEAGYGDRPEDAVGTAREVAECGAVGMNLEDVRTHTELYGLEAQVERIHAAHDAAPHLVINARTDVYLAGIGAPELRFAEAVRRANAYREAGAQCVFVPGVRDHDTIAALVRAIDGPVNILATVGAPSTLALETIGVRRVSVGSGPMRAAMGLVRRIGHELMETGTYDAMTGGAISYPTCRS